MLLFVQYWENTTPATKLYSSFIIVIHCCCWCCIRMEWYGWNVSTLLHFWNLLMIKTSICFKMPNAHSWIFFYPCSNVFLSKNINGLTFLFFKYILCLTSVDEVVKTLADLELHNQDSKLRITSGPTLRYHYTIL